MNVIGSLPLAGGGSRSDILSHGSNFKSFSTHETKLYIPFSLPALSNSMLFTIGSRVPDNRRDTSFVLDHQYITCTQDISTISRPKAMAA